MENIKTYPIGQQDFAILKGDQCKYVDKTQYIENLLFSKSKYFFLSRPQGFGKSLFLSTLRYFFEGRRELFAGLYIDSINWDWQTNPVLNVDLNQAQYYKQQQLDILLDNIFSKWEVKFGVSVKNYDLSKRFWSIIEEAHKKTGRKVVILVDDYDKPLIENLSRGDNFAHYHESLSALYTIFNRAEEHIQMVFLTGVFRFSKLSVFTDQNNLMDLSFSDSFADICGFTDKELHQYFKKDIGEFAEYRGISYEEALILLKENYDGYKFSIGGSEIYHPWSLFNALQEKKIANYWTKTIRSNIIAEYLKIYEEELDYILNISCSFRTLINLNLENFNPIKLLYQYGYITIKKNNKDDDNVTLGIPNLEVKESLMEDLLPYYVKVKHGAANIVVNSITQGLVKGEVKKCVRDLQFFLKDIPYERNIGINKNIQNAIYLLTNLIDVNPETKIWRISESDGMMEIVIITPKYLYIITLKFAYFFMDTMISRLWHSYPITNNYATSKVYFIELDFCTNKYTTHSRRRNKPIRKIVIELKCKIKSWINVLWKHLKKKK